MELITKEIQSQLNKAGYHGQTAICKFFNPCGAATWVIFGQDNDHKDTLVCVADLGMDCIEAGPISLSELESVTLRFGLKIERDIHFEGGKSMSHYLALDTLAGC